MTTQYIEQPSMITIAPDFTGIAKDRLDAGFYRVSFHPNIGYHLVRSEPLNTPKKVYGSLLKHVPRISEVFAERVGVATTLLLEGLKGSGKSLMMKTIANNFVNNDDGIVISVDEAYSGADFFAFLQKITQPKVILMDEFDKTYNTPEARNSILTLLDGNYATHALFILTMNASSDSKGFEFFHNRPGRVFFSIKFKEVDVEAIKEYLIDCLVDQSRLSEVIQFTKRFTKLNMDMLATLTREINARRGMTLDDIAEYLNVKPDLSIDDVFFNVTVKRNGMDVTKHLRASAISTRNIRDFIVVASRQNGSRTEILNLESVDQDYVTDTLEPWDKVRNKYKNEKPEITYGIVVEHDKKKHLIEGFDHYMYSDSVQLVQDNETGHITLTGTVDGVLYEVTCVPEVMKAYRMAF